MSRIYAEEAGRIFSYRSELRKEIEAEIQNVKQMRNELLRVKKPNPFIPAVAECVEIKLDEDQGRHLVVNRDVCAGNLSICI